MSGYAGRHRDAVAPGAKGAQVAPVVGVGAVGRRRRRALLVAGLAVVLWVVSGFIRDRQIARGQAAGGPRSAAAPASRESLPPATPSRQKGGSPIDDELADIEALLRKRGIE